ncbi:MAG: 16S rRNA (cytosine(1402)-N(4))-methyltransferase RsmH [Anaerolineales bacterium]|nr:16S rRNA (cytosine(1402)-N(4))-methyltransferase RsmH [Anaerolineales bacterium]
MPITGQTLESNNDQTLNAARGIGHVPVLYREALEALSIIPGGIYLDGTVGAGGHAAGILEQSAPNGQLLGLDRDPEAIELASRRLAGFGERVSLVNSSYHKMKSVAHELSMDKFDGILLDLGFSSIQIGNPYRGFSFQEDGPLDMRYNPDDFTTADDLVNNMPEEELADLIYRYGEESNSRRIARAIVAARPIHTTGKLEEIVSGATKRSRGSRKVHPATQTFQALRIAVNRELELLAEALPQAVELLKPGGRLAVISFHSLEDRIVKRFIKKEATDCICPPELPICKCNHKATLKNHTPKPIRPTGDEVQRNQKSRSARLRVAIKY